MLRRLEREEGEKRLDVEVVRTRGYRLDLLHLIHGENMGEFVKVILGECTCDRSYWNIMLR